MCNLKSASTFIISMPYCLGNYMQVHLKIFKLAITFTKHHEIESNRGVVLWWFTSSVYFIFTYKQQIFRKKSVTGHPEAQFSKEIWSIWTTWLVKNGEISDNSSPCNSATKLQVFIITLPPQNGEKLTINIQHRKIQFDTERCHNRVCLINMSLSPNNALRKYP
jgi:hypothetical protein